MRPCERKALNQTAAVVGIYSDPPGSGALLEARFPVFTQKVFWRDASWEDPSRGVHRSRRAFCVKNLRGGRSFEPKPPLFPRFNRSQESSLANRVTFRTLSSVGRNAEGDLNLTADP
jgi:hypothetical protein